MNEEADIKVYIEWLDMLMSDFPSFANYLAGEESDFWDEFHSSKIESAKYDDLSLYCGMSRGVFVSDNCDYAIKFALNKRGEEDCEKEVANYQAAIKENIQEMFASVEFGFVYRGKKFYLCERADADEDYAFERAASYSGRDIEDISGDDEEAVDDIFYSYYEYWLVNQFIDFCDKMGINDIHMANIGFDGNTVKCIDYAGY